MARHVFRCPLRWFDMDVYGHVNNVVFMRYLEEARIDLLFRQGTREGGVTLQSGSVVSRHEVDYLRPLVHGYEPVTIEIWVTRLTAASITFAYEVKDDERVYLRASTVVVPYDLAAARPRRLTPEERAFLLRYQDEPAADEVEGAVAV